MWVHMEDAFSEEGSLMRWPAKFSTEMICEYDWIMRAERIWHLPVGDQGYYNEGKYVDNNRLVLDHAYLYHFTNARYGYYNSFDEFGGGQPCSVFTEKNANAPGFSVELVTQSLLMSCPKEGVVLDPFCGGLATTGRVALEIPNKYYSFIGIEKDSAAACSANDLLKEQFGKQE